MSVAERHLKYMMDLRPFAVNKLPEDGTLMSKQVRLDTHLRSVFRDLFY